ncbi:MAG: TIGR01244 family sulfur transferase [Burkholderiaceae bacterium]
MELKQLTPDLKVAGQLRPEDMAAVAASGVRSLICNRPDGEAADQPATAAIIEAAEKQGLRFRDIPFTAGRQTPQDVAAFAAALDELPKPVLAYCRSGMRSTTIWAMSQAGVTPVESLVRTAAAAGYDIQPMRPVLDALAGAARG